MCIRDRTYKDHDYLIRNVLLTPSLGIGARYSGEKFDGELRGGWSHRTVPESRYEVGVEMCIRDRPKAVATLVICSVVVIVSVFSFPPDVYKRQPEPRADETRGLA